MPAGRVGEVPPSRHFVALPSVTPTSKPAVSPVAGKIKGTDAGEEFRPCLALDGKDLTPDRFRRLLADDGLQFLALSGYATIRLVESQSSLCRLNGSASRVKRGIAQ